MIAVIIHNPGFKKTSLCFSQTLDSALSKQEMLEKMQAQACPPRRKSPHRSATAPKDPSVLTAAGPRKPTNPKRAVHGEN